MPTRLMECDNGMAIHCLCLQSQKLHTLYNLHERDVMLLVCLVLTTLLDPVYLLFDPFGGVSFVVYFGCFPPPVSIILPLVSCRPVDTWM